MGRFIDCAGIGARGACLAAALGIGTAGALGAPANRVIDAIAAAPSEAGPGMYDISVRWHIEAGDEPGGVQDLGTKIVFLKNGQEIAVTAQPVFLDPEQIPGCEPGNCEAGLPCGIGVFGPSQAVLLCFTPGPGLCECRSPELEGALPAVALLPGDVIQCVLEPMPGALPDPPDGNSMLEQMTAEGMGWNRAVRSAEIVENDQGEQVLRGETAVTAFGYTHPTELDFVLALKTGPAFEAELAKVSVEVFPFDGCFFDCEPDGCPEPSSDPGGGHWETFCTEWSWSWWWKHCTCQNIYIVDIFPIQLNIETWDELFDPGRCTCPRSSSKRRTRASPSCTRVTTRRRSTTGS